MRWGVAYGSSLIARAYKALGLREKAVAIELLEQVLQYLRTCPSALTSKHLQALISIANEGRVAERTRLEVLRAVPSFKSLVNRDIKKQLQAPFIIYADFECYTTKIASCASNPKHEPPSRSHASMISLRSRSRRTKEGKSTWFSWRSKWKGSEAKSWSSIT